jgi:hypothetical protein
LRETAIACSAQPILDRQPVDPREFPLVVGNDRQSKGDGLGGDQQIVRPDESPRPLERRAQLAVDPIGGRLEWQHVERGEHGFELRRQPPGIPLGRAAAQLGRDDDAGADRRLANLRDARGGASAGIADEIRNDIRIEEEAHGARSEIDRVVRQLLDRGKILGERPKGRKNSEERARRRRLGDQAPPFASNDRVLARQLELTWNPRSLVSAVPEELDVALR